MHSQDLEGPEEAKARLIAGRSWANGQGTGKRLEALSEQLSEARIDFGRRGPTARPGCRGAFCRATSFARDYGVSGVPSLLCCSPCCRLYATDRRSGRHRAIDAYCAVCLRSSMAVRESRMPSLCIRSWSVERFTPRRAAAPFGPATTPFAFSKARRI